MASHARLSAWSKAEKSQAPLALSASRYTLAETGERVVNRDFVDQAERLAVVAIALAAQAAALLAEQEQGEGSGDDRGKCGSAAVPSFAEAMKKIERKKATAYRRYCP